MRLTDNEFRDVLARAEAIQLASRSDADMRAELEAVIGAAEEVGLSRSAVERAIRERFALTAPPPVGSLAFARSADGKFYVADVQAISPEGVRVKFLEGGEHLVSPDQVRPCAFIPGERIVCNWPWWGPWTCSVASYDAEKRRVKLSDGWGETRTFPIAEVWLPASRLPEDNGAKVRVVATLMGGAAVGGLVGSILTALLMR